MKTLEMFLATTLADFAIRATVQPDHMLTAGFRASIIQSAVAPLLATSGAMRSDLTVELDRVATEIRSVDPEGPWLPALRGLVERLGASERVAASADDVRTLSVGLAETILLHDFASDDERDYRALEAEMEDFAAGLDNELTAEDLRRLADELRVIAGSYGQPQKDHLTAIAADAEESAEFLTTADSG